MNKFKTKRRILAALILVFFTVTVTTGCESLRKKFTRKKKTGEESEGVMPLLEPVDYPEKVETSATLYQRYYSLWQVWYKEFVVTMEEGGGSDKRALYDLNQLLTQLGDMQKIVIGEKQKQLAQHYTAVEGVIKKYNQPAPVRNTPVLKSTIDSVDKQMRRNFKPGDVRDFLIK
jgi:hypothetical protein